MDELLKNDAVLKANDVGNKNWRKDLPLLGLYRLYNKEDELLYIGWSTNLGNRILEHVRGRSNTKAFHEEIYKIILTSADSMDDIFNQIKNIDDIEKYMVRELNPKYNVVYQKNNLYHSPKYGFVYRKRP